MAAPTQPVSFDHRDAGTAESAWVASGLLESARPVDLSALRRLIVLAAHPDDESLGAGGLIAEAAGRGVPVTVVVVTNGEASHPDSPTLRPADLAAIRRVEVRSAIARLAPRADVHLMGLPDGRLTEMVGPLTARIASLVVDWQTSAPVRAPGGGQDPDGIPGDSELTDTAVHGGDLGGGDSYRGDSYRGDTGAGATWLVAPWLLDNHPDHAAVAEAARRISGETGYRHLEYPVWAWHWAHPNDGILDPELLVAVDLSTDARRVKERAMGEHRSQLEPLSAAPGDEAVVPEGFQEHFLRSKELFVNVGSTTGGSTSGGSLDRGFFDGFYTAGRDPWGFESHWYEKRKRAITMASLPRERFASAFEPGCSIGVLTAELAERCDLLLATDISQTPLTHARRRLQDCQWVSFEQLQVPQQWPAGRFDLIVLSEIGYYCGTDDLSILIRSAVGSLTDDGVLLACHWRHPVSEYPLSGDEVHARLRSESGLQVLAGHVEEDFRLDVFVHPPAISVARRDGLVR